VKQSVIATGFASYSGEDFEVNQNRRVPSGNTITDRLGVLSEWSRLRLLRLLESEELAVGELASILQMPQSTVSRHLKVLLEGGWLARRSEGTAGRYWMDPAGMASEDKALWELVRVQMGDGPQLLQDDHRLQDVLAQRRTDTVSYFGTIGGEWSTVRREMFGDSFTDEALLSLISHDWMIADLGCGTGELTARLAPIVQGVCAVDMSQAMLEAARVRLREYENVSFHEGDLLAIPLGDGSVDAACASLVLHHIADIDQAIAEMVRIVRQKNGTVLIIEMMKHDREEYRRQMGHQHLGFEPEELKGMMEDAGLGEVRYRVLTSRGEAKGPDLFVIVGKRGG